MNIEHKIVFFVKEDGYLSIKQLAEKLSRNEGFVRKRVNKMVEKGEIHLFSKNPNTYAAGSIKTITATQLMAFKPCQLLS